MDSKLDFGCMRSAGCGLNRESVASWGVEGCGCLAGCVGEHVRCTKVVLGLWLVVLPSTPVARGKRGARRFKCMEELRRLYP